MSKWNKVKYGCAMARLAVITPSWLRVDRAIIFFMSHSFTAFIPAINIVSIATIRRILWKRGDLERSG